MSATPPTVEVYNGSSWVDLTASRDVRSADAVTITRGRRSEGSTADPSEIAVTLDNRDGAFSTRNPNSPNFGLIGRNTPLRVSVPLPSGSGWLDIPSAGQASTPDSVALSITGDMDVRADVWAASWWREAEIAAKWSLLSRSWIFQVLDGGFLELRWTDGAVFPTAVSTVPVPAPVSGRRTIRVTIQVNTPASFNTVTFYTGTGGVGGSFTQLGAPVVASGTTSIRDTAAPLTVGVEPTIQATQPLRVYGLQVRSGVAGTVQANPDFTTQTHGVTSFADSAGNTWTVFSPAAIVRRDYRGYGEVSQWPVRWDQSGRNVTSPIVASGVLRRLGQGARPLRSAYYRGVTSTVSPMFGLQAYWPMEDTAGATSFAAAYGRTARMTISGTATLASDSSFASSEPLPVMGSATAVGRVPTASVGTGSAQLRFLMSVPSGSAPADSTVLVRLACSGTAVRWDLLYRTGGAMSLNAYDAAGASLLATGSVSFGLDGQPCRVNLTLAQNGTGIDWALSTIQTATGTLAGTSGTLATQAVTAATGVTIAPGRNMTSVTFGHVTVQGVATSSSELYNQITGYTGEGPADRIQRLCTEEGIPVLVIGSVTPSTSPMGVQRAVPLLDLLREAEATDGGLLAERRDALGILFLARDGLLQNPSVTTTYAAAALASIEPTEDDQHITNDVTTTRAGGSSARYVVSSGRLSSAAPPAGIGLYDTSTELSLQDDARLADQASWIAHVGTVDEARYPSLAVNLAHPKLAGTALATSMLTLDVGSRLQITAPPAFLPPDTIDQLVIGTVERLDAFGRRLEWVCQPYSPYRVAVYDDTASRYSSVGSTISGAFSAGATSLSVATPSGPLWTSVDGSFQVRLGSGEVVTVTGVTGSSSPQTFTVTRAVNGIAKALTGGETLDLAAPVYYAI